MPLGYKLLIFACALVAAASLPLAPYLFLKAEDSADDAQSAADHAQSAASVAENSAAESREVACRIARLVSYVPALQFEGEPRSNFIGWIQSRRDLLLAISQTDACSDMTQKILAQRVRLDERELERLGVEVEPGRPSEPGGGDALGTPDNGGGQPGGDQPPAQQGVLDPIIDPVAPGLDCDVTVTGVVLCTEPD